MRYRCVLLGATALALTMSPSLADHHMAKAIKTAKTMAGDVLTNAEGMTFYVFDRDKRGVSNCAGECAKLWPLMPAATASKSEAKISIVKRPDDNIQRAYKDQPLYTWFKDAKADDATGDGVKGVWHVARP